jgi:hypothetical protein
MMYIKYGECYQPMYVHSPRHLAEWAELIGASLPDEYVKCDRDDGNNASDGYKQDTTSRNCSHRNR